MNVNKAEGGRFINDLLLPSTHRDLFTDELGQNEKRLIFYSDEEGNFVRVLMVIVNYWQEENQKENYFQKISNLLSQSLLRFDVKVQSHNLYSWCNTMTNRADNTATFNCSLILYVRRVLKAYFLFFHVCVQI